MTRRSPHGEKTRHSQETVSSAGTPIIYVSSLGKQMHHQPSEKARPRRDPSKCRILQRIPTCNQYLRVDVFIDRMKTPLSFASLDSFQRSAVTNSKSLYKITSLGAFCATFMLASLVFELIQDALTRSFEAFMGELFYQASPCFSRLVVNSQKRRTLTTFLA